MSASWLFHSFKKLSHWMKKVLRLIPLTERPTSNMWLAATLPYHLWVTQAQDVSTETMCSWVPSKRTNWRNQFLPGVSWQSRSFLQQQHFHQPKCKGYAIARWSLKKFSIVCPLLFYFLCWFCLKLEVKEVTVSSSWHLGKRDNCRFYCVGFGRCLRKIPPW